MKNIVIIGSALICLSFGSVSLATNNDNGKSVEGIYTGNLIVDGVPSITITFNLDGGGNLTEISEGMINNPVVRETAATGKWRHSKKGSVDLVEVIYMNGGVCAFIGQSSCALNVGANGKIDREGRLTAKLTNFTVKSLAPNPPINLDLTQFSVITIDVKKQKFDDLLFSTP